MFVQGPISGGRVAERTAAWRARAPRSGSRHTAQWGGRTGSRRVPAPRWPGCVARGTSFYLQGLPHLQRGLMLMTVGGGALKWGAYGEQLARRSVGRRKRVSRLPEEGLTGEHAGCAPAPTPAPSQTRQRGMWGQRDAGEVANAASLRGLRATKRARACVLRQEPGRGPRR